MVKKGLAAETTRQQHKSVKIKVMQFVSNGMHHTPSTTMVFQSDDYNRFNMIKGNRSLDMNKIKKILSDIERGTNLLQYCPIIVVEKNKKLEIVDGQHRFVVAKKIKSPVYYIIGTDLSLYDIAKMNSNTEKWNVHDFIACYKELGNKNYVRLEEVLKEYKGLTAANAINLLVTGRVEGAGNTKYMDDFHRGLFEIRKEEEALYLLNKAKAFNHEGKFSRHFLVAIMKVINADVFNIDDLISKVNDNISALQYSDHWRKYLSNMEEIVTKGKSKRVAIY